MSSVQNSNCTCKQIATSQNTTYHKSYRWKTSLNSPRQVICWGRPLVIRRQSQTVFIEVTIRPRPLIKQKWLPFSLLYILWHNTDVCLTPITLYVSNHSFVILIFTTVLIGAFVFSGFEACTLTCVGWSLVSLFLSFNTFSILLWTSHFN